MKEAFIQTPIGKRKLRCNCNSKWEVDFVQNKQAVCVNFFNPEKKICPVCNLNYWVNSKELFEIYISSEYGNN